MKKDSDFYAILALVGAMAIMIALTLWAFVPAVIRLYL